jgi:hypothetical protein
VSSVTIEPLISGLACEHMQRPLLSDIVVPYDITYYGVTYLYDSTTMAFICLTSTTGPPRPTLLLLTYTTTTFGRLSLLLDYIPRPLLLHYTKTNVSQGQMRLCVLGRRAFPLERNGN